MTARTNWLPNDVMAGFQTWAAAQLQADARWIERAEAEPVNPESAHRATVVHMQALTIQLPEPLHEELRHEAFTQRTTINALIIEQLEHRHDA